MFHFPAQLEEEVTAHKRFASSGDTAGIGGDESLCVIPSEVEESRAVFDAQERTNVLAIWQIGAGFPREIDSNASPTMRDHSAMRGMTNDERKARYAERNDLTLLC